MRLVPKILCAALLGIAQAARLWERDSLEDF